MPLECACVFSSHIGVNNPQPRGQGFSDIYFLEHFAHHCIPKTVYDASSRTLT